MIIDMLPVEIVRLVIESVRRYTDRKSTIASLSRTCKYLHEVCQPLLYEDMSLDKVPHKLLPAAYTLFTCPHLARRVRGIKFAAHGAAPVLLWRQQSIDEPLLRPTERRGWPDAPGLDELLRSQVALALDGETETTINQCFTAVRDGTREDLVAVLILMNIPSVEFASLGAMGPRNDNSITRLIFRNAAPRLTMLDTVIFGKYPHPPEWDQLDKPRPDLDFSYALFADLFRLPALKKLYIHSIAPFLSQDIPQIREESCDFFNFIHDIDSENTTLERLYLSEEAVCGHAHLEHVLTRCPAVNYIDFFYPSIW